MVPRYFKLLHRVAPASLALALLCAVAGCASRAPGQAFVAQAERLHEQALAPAITRDTDLNDYLQLVGERLKKAANAEVRGKAQTFPDVRFHLVNNLVINAFSTGGPHVYVYNGLLQACASEEELAAAMAHAYAHAINLDVEETGQRPTGDLPLPLLMWQYVTNRFTPQQEQAADELAFRLYCRAGWDPAMFEFIFQKLSDLYPATAIDRRSLSDRTQFAQQHLADAKRDWRQLPVADARTFRALRDQANTLANDARPPVATDVFLLAFPNCILSADLPLQLAAQERLRPRPPATPPVEPN